MSRFFRIITSHYKALLAVAILLIDLVAEGRFSVYRLLLISFALFFTSKAFQYKRAVIPFLVLVSLSLVSVNFLSLEVPTFDNPDSVGFWALSRGTVNDLGINLVRPKIYPWFLSLFSEPIFVSYAQTVLRLGIVVLIIFAGRTRNWPLPVLMITAILFGINALWIGEQGQILDTTVFTFLWLLSFVSFLKLNGSFSLYTLVLFGVSSGLCTLTRQVADPFILLCYAWLLYRYKSQWRPLTMALGLFFLIGWMGMWINWAKYGVPQRSVRLGINLYCHSQYFELEDLNSPEWDLMRRVLGKDTVIKYSTHYRSPVNWTINDMPHLYQRYLEKGGMTRPESDNFLKGQFFDWVKANPLKYLNSVINEFKRAVLKTEERFPSSILNKWLPLPAELVRAERTLIHFPIWLLFLVPIPLFCLKRGWNVMLVFSYFISAAYLLMISALNLGLTRFSLPILPFLYMCLGEVMALYKHHNMGLTTWKRHSI